MFVGLNLMKSQKTNPLMNLIAHVHPRKSEGQSLGLRFAEYTHTKRQKRVGIIEGKTQTA